MLSLKRTLLICLLVVASAAFCSPAIAAAKNASQAAAQAQKRNGGGKVLGVSESNKNGRKIYKVKLIDKGKVRVITIRGE
ncbi:hypothetical protein Q4485_13250 [Granulosicoccaceae sp. 1_MG-2023]|nr:hypothetical protein [Granulosicoccaceae sp. 1_MG-2023]